MNYFFNTVKTLNSREYAAVAKGWRTRMNFAVKL